MKAVLEKINHNTSLFKKFQLKVPFFDAPWHFHPECEIVYIEEGYGKQYIGDNVKSFSDGGLVMIGSNVPHFWISHADFYKEDKYRRSKAKVIQFSQAFPGNMIDFPELKWVKKAISLSSRGIQVHGGTRKQIAELIEQFFKAEGIENIQLIFLILEIFGKTSEYELLASSNFSKSFGAPTDKKIEAAYNFVMQHYNRSMQIEEVADFIGMHPTAFCRYFKSRTKMTFIDFLTEVRIGYSCKLLMETNFSITQTCFESGFNNISNFNRQFKKLKGITPKEFRNQFSALIIK